jgi:hypothetical protein
VPLLTRRPARYVPRHSTRGAAPQWTAAEVVDLTAAGAHSPQEVLSSVLVALDELDREAAARQS